MSLLEVSNVTVSFGGLVAVNNVSLEVKKGEIISLVGPNGAGKTTLFNVITGYLQSDQGDVFLEDIKVTDWPPFRRAKAGLVRTFQQNELFGKCTAEENVLMAHHLACGGWDALKSLRSYINPMNNPEAMDSSACKRAKEILEYVGLAQKADVQALSLPHGEQRLLGIGVALAANPKILLLDEPVGGMTHEEAEKVIDLIYDIRSEGMTVFFIEHNMGVVMNIAERVIVLDHGEQIAEGAPDQVKTNPRMIEAYLGKWE